VEADEVRAADRPHAVELAATLVEENDVLGAAEPERLHEPPRSASCSASGSGTFGYAAATRIASKGACSPARGRL
jgi:hypothetical protein